MADCDWIIVCDYAFLAVPGKLCLVGIFDTIFASDTPATHPRLAVGFSITGEPGEKGEIKLEIIGPTGQVVGGGGGQFTLPDAGSAQAHLEVVNLLLSDFGRYAIQIDLGENIPRVAWFTLTRVPK